jgi:hypothetical protein
VSHPGVTIQVEEGTTFDGVLDIRAEGVKLSGVINAIKSIFLASGIEADPSVQEAIAAIEAAQLSVLNQTEDPEEMLGTLKALGYRNATLWHAHELIEYRKMEFFNGFESLQRAREAIGYVMRKEPPINYLNGEYEGELPFEITSYVIGDEDRLLGPSNEWAENKGQLEVDNLIIAGAGTGTYTIRNLLIKGDLTINVPRGNVTLDSTVKFAQENEGSRIWIKEISGGIKGIGGVTSHTSSLPPFIHVMDSNASRLELSPEYPAYHIPGVVFETAGQTELAGIFNSVYIDIEHYLGGEGEEGSKEGIEGNEGYEGNNEGSNEANVASRLLSLSDGAVIQTLNLNTPFLELGEIDGVILQIDVWGMNENAELHFSVMEYMALLDKQHGDAREALFAESYEEEAKTRFEDVLRFIGMKEADIQEEGKNLWGELRGSGEEELPFNLKILWSLANMRRL